jgi:hypothetical protein
MLLALLKHMSQWWKKGYWSRFVRLICLVGATGTNKAGLKTGAFSSGCLRTGTKGPPRGPGHVMRLEVL